ncbi:MAG TPA: error-prone DNA polymerase [Xanthobacteraceae bacterium]
MSIMKKLLQSPPCEDENKKPPEPLKPTTRYVEFAVASNFSFLYGASHPGELIGQAEYLGYAGIGLCDRNSVAGVVRAHLEKREKKLSLRYHPGARLVFADDTPDILAYPRDRDGWGRLCRLLTRGNLRAAKGECILYLDDLLEFSEGLELIVMAASTRSAPAKFLHHTRTSFFVQDKTEMQRRTEVASPACFIPSTGADRQRDAGGPAAASIAAFSAPVTELRSFKAERRPRADKTSDRVPLFLSRLREAASGRLRLAANMLYRGNDRARLAARARLARDAGIPLIAVNDVRHHHLERQPLQDVLTCIREHVTIDAAGRKLEANAERHLKFPDEMARLFSDAPEAIAETLRLSEALTFSLDQLSSEYPEENRESFATPQQALECFTWKGAAKRYPREIPPRVRERLEHEFKLIAARDYAPFFLTVHHIVQFAREKEILCQGRGSAANSAVCYCLGITEVDPERHQLLFERFISENRGEPPDIDVDFEHERREEVIQHIYGHYGREHTGIAATVISYRGRSAIREVGKVFGLSEDMIGALASSIWGMGGGNVRLDALRAAGLDPESPRVAQIIFLAKQIQGFPRHLSQHVGGFVITRSRLDEVVPIMNGAMEKRTHVEWDKDDLDALNLLKVDVLGLGMLSCIRKAFDLIQKHYGGPRLTIASIPAEQKAVYNMLCRADSIGVFQVESRAQMSMLPRLAPRQFYDLVIEVAIVRPGPIQGDMVHPYLRRRQGVEDPVIPSPKRGNKDALKKILKRTLGVPLFQEQAMKIAIDAGGFTPGEADKLRRAMATFKRTGTIGTFRDKMINGMTAKGYEREFAERCFSQIEGFGEYGFPESHAASFALLVYASAWLKCRYPDVFAAALLNSQPMGFYAPAQIVRDVREHGVEVRPVDINRSDYDYTLEHGPRAARRVHAMHQAMQGDIRAEHAMRMGFRAIKGISQDDAELILARRIMAYTSVSDLWQRTGLSPRVLERLADADAFGSLGLTRRQALWAVKALGRAGDQDALPLFTSPQAPGEREPPPAALIETLPHPDALPAGGESGRSTARGKIEASTSGFSEPPVALPAMPLGEEVVNDYRFLSLSLRAHPAAFLRADLARLRIMPNEQLRTTKAGTRVRVSGLVTIRQRPGSAQGVIFMTIEDESGIANIIVWPKVFERFRMVVMGARYVAATGRMQEEKGVIHVVAERLEDLTPLLARLTEDLPPVEALARADAVKRPHSENRQKPRRSGTLPVALPLLEYAEVAADLDAPARGSAHTVARRAAPKRISGRR